jgi:hypothetical protein
MLINPKGNMFLFSKKLKAVTDSSRKKDLVFVSKAGDIINIYLPNN